MIPLTIEDAQQEAYYAYDPASGIPEEQFTMEFIKSKYPELIKPKVETAVVPEENRLQGILSSDYFKEVPPEVSVKDKLKKRMKGALLPDGWDYDKGQVMTPMGLSFGKKGLGYSTKF